MAAYAVMVPAPKSFPETLVLRALVTRRDGRDLSVAELAAVQALFPSPKKRRTRKHRDANLLARLLPRGGATTLPIPGQLGALLTSSGKHAALAITRDDGTPLDAESLASVRAQLAAWEVRERQILEVIRAAAALHPAGDASPRETLRAAVEALDGAGSDAANGHARARRKPAPKHKAR